MRVARVYTHRACNQKCGFCVFRRPLRDEDRDLAATAAVRARVAEAAQGGAEVVITGGEPTMRRDLATLVAHAKAAGAARVVLETNAALLDDGAVEALRAAGLDVARVHLPVFGPALDALTLDPGGFQATRRALDRLAAAEVALEASAPVVAVNAGSLPTLPERLVESGLPFRALLLCVPVSAPEPGALLPLGEAARVVEAVESVARAVGLVLRMDGHALAPPCLFERPARVAHLFALTRGGAAREGFVKEPVCGACVAEDRCPGLPAAALAADPALRPRALADDRIRRRLSVISTVQDQVERELFQEDLYRREDGSAVPARIVRVNFHCNQSCHFCFVSTHLPAAPEGAVLEAIRDIAARRGVLALSGGEPTLHPRLLDFIRAAREGGVAEVELQTNAIRLADPALARAVHDAGVDVCFVSLHGSHAELSDAVTDAPGTFDRTVLGIDAARAAGLKVRLNFVFCEANAADFPTYVELVARRWPGTAINVSFVAPSTDVVPRSRALVPRYADVIPHLADGIRRGEALGVDIGGFSSMCGVPLCLVPGDLTAYFTLARIPDGFDRGELLRADACRECALEDRCFGLRRGYADLHGTSELRPISRSAAARSPAPPPPRTSEERLAGVARAKALLCRAMSDDAYRYDGKRAGEIEERWQAYWAAHGTLRQPGPGDAGFDPGKPKFYCLDMFPYPSGAGLHVGHPEGYTATDIISRYKRMRGFNVLHPMGWDAFGLPAEQYAIQTGVHPVLTTRKAIDTFRRQLQRFGFSYDWERELGTIDEPYYRWTQWIFLRIYGAFFDPERRKARPIEELVAELESGARVPRVNPEAAEHGPEVKARRFGPWRELAEDERRLIVDSFRLAYVGEQTVNWCPKLGTALANEEVIDGRSERGGFPVLRKPLRQWLFRITAYGERLLESLDELDWPQATKTKQADWIGRSEGAEVDFRLEEPLGGTERFRVYTTRPDTLFGATYMVLAPEHPLVDAVLSAPRPGTDADAVRVYAAASRNRSDLERQQTREKTGVFTGLWAVNPVNRQRIPIWIADYVLMGYGHGAIMAVPAHDERDFEFATKYALPIVTVVEPTDGHASEGCFAGEGRNVASRNDEVSLDGLQTSDAKRVITEWLEQKELGRRKVNFKLRDWLFSRQRYWGEPFPIVYDARGRHHPVSDAALPVVLPELADYQPEESDEPKPLLAKAAGWVETTAGEAGVAGLPEDAKVTRETNTMPGWAGSCWYFLRYCDPRNDQRLVSREADAYWMGEGGVDLYIGGAEHAVLHLLYARFWQKALYDLGHVGSPEPFRKLFHQGLIMSYAYQRADRSLVPTDQVRDDGSADAPRFLEVATGEELTQVVAKMSKSLKNVVNPDDVIATYGADTFRLYEMYMGPLETSKPWNTHDILGMFRFLQRAHRLLVDEKTGTTRLATGAEEPIERLLHRTVAAVGVDIERLSFNTAIAKLIELVNAATSAGGLTRDQACRFVLVLAPFAPHLAEELWSLLGQAPSVTTQPWPAHDEGMLRDDTIEIPVQIMGKVRARIVVPAEADAGRLEELALAAAHEKGLLDGKQVRKVIVVPGRLVNIVAS